MTSAPDQTPGASGATLGAAGSAGTAGTTDQPSGLPPHRPPGYGDEQRLHRGDRGRMLAGVAVGLVALAFLGGLAVPLYLAGWLLIPDEDSDVSVAEELLARERARGAF
jgi:phage shock protein PspC (stress-responsive transcriptional regulator)